MWKDQRAGLSKYQWMWLTHHQVIRSQPLGIVNMYTATVKLKCMYLPMEFATMVIFSQRAIQWNVKRSSSGFNWISMECFLSARKSESKPATVANEALAQLDTQPQEQHWPPPSTCTPVMSLSVCSTKATRIYLWPSVIDIWIWPYNPLQPQLTSFHLCGAMYLLWLKYGWSAYTMTCVLCRKKLWRNCLPDPMVRSFHDFSWAVFPFSDHNESLARLLPPTRIAPYWLLIKAVSMKFSTGTLYTKN